LPPPLGRPPANSLTPISRESALASISTVLEMTNASSRIALKSGSRAVLSLESLAISNTYL
jgi:metal-dependent HD superfamily phosphatase/phosphodiesterase